MKDRRGSRIQNIWLDGAAPARGPHPPGPAGGRRGPAHVGTGPHAGPGARPAARGSGRPPPGTARRGLASGGSPPRAWTGSCPTRSTAFPDPAPPRPPARSRQGRRHAGRGLWCLRRGLLTTVGFRQAGECRRGDLADSLGAVALPTCKLPRAALLSGHSSDTCFPGPGARHRPCSTSVDRHQRGGG